MNKPFVSIIVPAYNEADVIEQCVARLKQLDYPKDKYEIIVVDNGSQDDTRQCAEQAGAAVLLKPEGNVGAVRNHGVKHAKGEVFAFIDADCLAPSGWLVEALQCFESNHEVAAVGGVCTVPESASWVERVWAGGIAPHTRSTVSLASSSFIVRSEVFNKLDGFSEELSAAEDDDLSSRIRQQGYKLMMLEGCAVVHLGYPNSLMATLKRHMWHGGNQLDSAEHMFEKLLVLTHLFLLSSMLMPVAILFQSWSLLLLGAVFVFGVPVLSAVYREVLQNKSGFQPFTLLRLSAIFLFFFIGRSLGLLVNYKRRLLG